MTYAVIVAAVVAAVLLGRALFVVVTVVGISMEPAYHHGDRVLVLRLRWLALRRPGVVVVFTAQPRPDAVPPPPGFPGSSVGRRRKGRDWLIKRVVARPGEPTPDAVPVVPPGARVPTGHLVVYGDNGGVDSRGFGYLPLTRVRGVVIAALS
jgi:signal peptidase I